MYEGGGGGTWNRVVDERTDPKVIPRFKAIMVQWKENRRWSQKVWFESRIFFTAVGTACDFKKVNLSCCAFLSSSARRCYSLLLGVAVKIK